MFVSSGLLIRFKSDLPHIDRGEGPLAEGRVQKQFANDRNLIHVAFDVTSG